MNPCLSELTMVVHHSQERLNVFVFLVSTCLLVLIQLRNFLVTNFSQNLLWLLHSHRLSNSSLINSFDFVALIKQLGGVDHRRCSETGFLIESILHVLLL